MDPINLLQSGSVTILFGVTKYLIERGFTDTKDAKRAMTVGRGIEGSQTVLTAVHKGPEIIARSCSEGLTECVCLCSVSAKKQTAGASEVRKIDLLVHRCGSLDECDSVFEQTDESTVQVEECSFKTYSIMSSEEVSGEVDAATERTNEDFVQKIDSHEKTVFATFEYMASSMDLLMPPFSMPVDVMGRLDCHSMSYPVNQTRCNNSMESTCYDCMSDESPVSVEQPLYVTGTTLSKSNKEQLGHTSNMSSTFRPCVVSQSAVIGALDLVIADSRRESDMGVMKDQMLPCKSDKAGSLSVTYTTGTQFGVDDFVIANGQTAVSSKGHAEVGKIGTVAGEGPHCHDENGNATEQFIGLKGVKGICFSRLSYTVCQSVCCAEDNAIECYAYSRGVL